MARRSTKGRTKAARSPYKMLIALGVVAGLGLVYGWNTVFLAPQSRQRTEVEKKIASARQQEQDLRGQLAQLKKVAADTGSREAELARLGRLIPADADLAGAILTLNDTANQAQVAWSSFVPSPPTPGAGGGPMTMGISMKIGGTFAQIFDYLARLESLDRLVVVDSIQLSGSGGKLDVDIRARMFASGTGAAAPATRSATEVSTPTTPTTGAKAAAGSTTVAGAPAFTKAGG